MESYRTKNSNKRLKNYAKHSNLSSFNAISLIFQRGSNTMNPNFINL